MHPTIQLGLATAMFSVLCAASSAQQPADVIIHDSDNDQMAILTDLDGDGVYKTFGEQRTLAAGGPAPDGFEPFDAEVRIEAGRPVCYWVECDRPFPDPGPPYNGKVLRGEDLDGNGTFTGAEITLFRNLSGLDGPALPQGLALTPDGAVWFCSDIFPAAAGSVNGVRRLFDLNNDGDANDAGESVTMVNGANGGTHPVTTNSGTVTLPADSFFHMQHYQNGVVVFNNFDHSAIFNFRDLNSDGDVTDANESIVFLNATGETPSLDFNPDFASAGPGSDPRSLVVNPATPSNGWLAHVATRKEGNKDIVYAACDSSSTSQFKNNQFGEPIHGLIFRCEDKNNDGDANDVDETNTFYNGSGLGTGPLFLDKIIGLSVYNQWLYVGEFSSAGGVSVHRLRDLNNDGDAMDANEQGIGLWVANLDATDPPFPCFPTPSPPQGCTPFVRTITAHLPSAFSACSSCTSFCTAKAGLACGAASIGSTGSPSAARASGFIIEAGPARTCRSGLLMYNTGLAPSGLPFNGGTLCVDPMGIRRAGSTNSMGTPGGANCDGRFTIDMNSFAQGVWVVPDCAGLPSGIPPNNQAAFLVTPGQSVFAQFWGRDSVATGSFVSDGLGYVVGP